MTLASGGVRGRLWDVSSGDLLLKEFGWYNTKTVAFSPDGRKLAFGAVRSFSSLIMAPRIACKGGSGNELSMARVGSEESS